jgi:uncharacterized protein
MKNRIDRRRFIESGSAGIAATSIMLSGNCVNAAKGEIPKRKFGKTGIEVPILAFGCGSRFLQYEDEEEALKVLNRAIDLGITYLDTASTYGRGRSETRIGKLMKTRRKEVILQTKVLEGSKTRTRDDALRVVEESLKRLQTDYIDVLHIHSLRDDEDLANVEARNGALKALYELKAQNYKPYGWQGLSNCN